MTAVGRVADEHGGIGVLLLVPLVVAAVVVLAVANAASSVLLAAGRAADLADESAIAAVHSSIDGVTQPCAAAAAVVERAPSGGAARLVRCDAGPGGATTVVDVRVGAPLARLLGATSRSATAAAAITP